MPSKITQHILARAGACFVFIGILVALFFGNYFRTNHPFLIDFIVPVAGVLGAILFVYVLRKLTDGSLPKNRIFAVVCIFALAVLISELSIVAPIERIHFIKYGSFAFFIYFSFPPDVEQTGMRTLITLVAAMSLGIAEESLQLVMPGRVFDWRDISLNVAGAILGTLLAVVTLQISK